MTKQIPNYRILVVDDDPIVLEGLEILLGDTYEVVTASSGPDAIERVENDNLIATVVMDIKMPGMDGIKAAQKIRQAVPDLPIIFHTGFPGQYAEDDIDDKESPYDYVQKGSSVTRLSRAVRNAYEAFLARRGNRSLAVDFESIFGMIGRSAAMSDIYHVIERVAATDVKIMILGESGTGKELVARAVHKLSRRKNEPLAVFNCNHKSPDLVESELFGHSKGAFTGALEDRIGLFEYANGGTVFLDEIGDLDITTQAKVLRVLETGQYQAVGHSPEPRTTDIRILCATHRDLKQMVEDGKFREDLYYRLKGVVIDLPPLRDRKEDIPLLVRKFVDRFTIESDHPPKIFDSSALEVILDQEWPGNIRQLHDTIQSLIVMSESDIILGTDVEKYLGLDSSASSHMDSRCLAARTREFRRNCIISALEETGGNVNAAARMLEIDQANLRKLIKNYDIS